MPLARHAPDPKKTRDLVPWSFSKPPLGEPREGLYAAPHIEWLLARGVQGKVVVDLGPLEGATSFRCAEAGAREVIGVEASHDFFFRCLVAKELLGHRNVSFLYGDATLYLESIPAFEVVVASGILYHMADPIRLLRALGRAREVLLWTHYFQEGLLAGSAPRFDGFRREDGARLHRFRYADTSASAFCGGPEAVSFWMERADIERIFRATFEHVEVVLDTPDHPHGASFALYGAKF